MGAGSDVLLASRLADAYGLCVVGRGTMRESPTAMAFVVGSLDGNAGTAVVDLSRCEYLDSTFLGCLVRLHQRFNGGGAVRVRFVADAATAGRLLAASRLDRVLPLLAEPPAAVGVAVPLPSEASAEPAVLARHVMECHRQLAMVDGPNQDKFARIAEQMAAELARSG